MEFGLLLRELFATFRTALRPLTHKAVDDVPEDLDPRHVYLVGDEGQPWSAALLCPCRCGEVIQLSLMTRDRPRWRAEVEANGAVSLYPSVWRTRGCLSHFILRRGRVYWAKRGPPPAVRPPMSTRRTDIRA